jgi:hypothetical protein
MLLERETPVWHDILCEGEQPVLSFRIRRNDPAYAVLHLDATLSGVSHEVCYASRHPFLDSASVHRAVRRGGPRARRYGAASVHHGAITGRAFGAGAFVRAERGSPQPYQEAIGGAIARSVLALVQSPRSLLAFPHVEGALPVSPLLVPFGTDALRALARRAVLRSSVPVLAGSLQVFPLTCLPLRALPVSPLFVPFGTDALRALAVGPRTIWRAGARRPQSLRAFSDGAGSLGPFPQS